LLPRGEQIFGSGKLKEGPLAGRGQSALQELLPFYWFATMAFFFLVSAEVTPCIGR